MCVFSFEPLHRSPAVQTPMQATPASVLWRLTFPRVLVFGVIFADAGSNRCPARVTLARGALKAGMLGGPLGYTDY